MVQTDLLLRERIAEIRQFRTFIDRIEGMEREEVRRVFGKVATHNRNKRIVYSQFVVMHYSLAEGIITQAVTEWLNTALVSRPKLEELTEDFLQYVVRCKVKKLKDQDFSRWIPELTKLIQNCADELYVRVTETEARSMWPGNVDARKIRTEFLSKFSLNIEDRLSRSGADIVSLKNSRNDLTHGIKSWEDVGQEHTWVELKRVSNRVNLYLIRLVKLLHKSSAERYWLKAE